MHYYNISRFPYFFVFCWGSSLGLFLCFIVSFHFILFMFSASVNLKLNASIHFILFMIFTSITVFKFYESWCFILSRPLANAFLKFYFFLYIIFWHSSLVLYWNCKTSFRLVGFCSSQALFWKYKVYLYSAVFRVLACQSLLFLYALLWTDLSVLFWIGSSFHS